jgi:hypothetical protein
VGACLFWINCSWVSSETHFYKKTLGWISGEKEHCLVTGQLYDKGLRHVDKKGNMENSVRSW